MRSWLGNCKQNQARKTKAKPNSDSVGEFSCQSALPAGRTPWPKCGITITAHFPIWSIAANFVTSPLSPFPSKKKHPTLPNPLSPVGVDIGLENKTKQKNH